MAHQYCPCCYGRRVNCRICKTSHCCCSWNACKAVELEDKVLSVIKITGGAVCRKYIATELAVDASAKEVSAALQRLSKKQKVYCVTKRYWTIWE